MTAAAMVAEFDDAAGRTDRFYALAAHQGERFDRLLAFGQISMQLIHAVKRPTRPGVEEAMTSDNDFGYELETQVEAELTLAEASRPEEAAESPVAQWLFDPADVQREEIELRNLLGAIERRHP